jgi:hypothetical protein
MAGIAAALRSGVAWVGAVSTAGTAGTTHPMSAGSAGINMANESEWSLVHAAMASEWEQRPVRVEWTAASIPPRRRALRPALRRGHGRQPGAAPLKVVLGCAAVRQTRTFSRKVRLRCKADRPVKAPAPEAAPAETWAARQQAKVIRGDKLISEGTRGHVSRAFQAIILCLPFRRNAEIRAMAAAGLHLA